MSPSSSWRPLQTRRQRRRPRARCTSTSGWKTCAGGVGGWAGDGAEARLWERRRAAELVVCSILPVCVGTTTSAAGPLLRRTGRAPAPLCRAASLLRCPTPTPTLSHSAALPHSCAASL
eukprot:362856-Chlamydomonas_euryale.AAC.4